MKTEATTLCYLERDGQYLMLHRTKKKEDVNAGKWIGIGGHIEDGESPDECLLREVKEETGLTLTDYRYRGVITFLYGDVSEIMFLFTSDAFTGELLTCDEGELCWIAREDVFTLPIWEGDRIFLRLLLEDAPFFSLKLVYDTEGRLTEHTLRTGV